GWDDPTGAIDTVLPGEHLPMTAFKKCTRSIEAGNDSQRWLMLAGYDYDTGSWNPFGDSSDATPGDKRTLQSAGPFELAPGEIDTLLIAIVFSNGNTGGLDYLKQEADLAKSIWDSLFTGISEQQKTNSSKDCYLSQNLPNPFKQTTQIQYAITNRAQVTIKVYDITGRLVKMLVNGVIESGYYSVTWDGKDEKGEPLASGMYFYRLEAGKNKATRKLILLH
ncbi:T9SS type A sorting domain-containing protein, partial [candidate division WOR-3 bacterium]|nr:T9SS type A sorting domain-containing protein [candidate division WOR-3 bacterium]